MTAKFDVILDVKNFAGYSRVSILRAITVKKKPLNKYTVQKMKFFIMDFFSKCDQIHTFLWIWSHLLKKSLMENFFFFSVMDAWTTNNYVPSFKKASSRFIDGNTFLTFLHLFTALHKKWGFLLRISSVNVTKSAGNLCSAVQEKARSK